MRPTILILFSCLQFATSQSSDLESFLYQVGDLISAISTSQSDDYYHYDEDYQSDENYQSDGYYQSDKFYQSDQSSSCITSSGPAAGQPCVFPFTHNGITYNQCAYWTHGGIHEGKRWCSTNTDRNGKHINGKGFYGFCPDTPGCGFTEQPAAEGSPPETVSSVARIGISSSCVTCKRLQQCPPKKPCKSRRGGCNKPYCSRRGKCWCPRN